MKNVKIKNLTKLETKIVFGGKNENKKYNLPKPEFHEETTSNSLEKSKPFSNTITGNMKPNNGTALDEYIKKQQEKLGTQK